MIYECLVTMDTDYKYQPGLAEKWEVSDDGLTWTFYLKKGVKFHDGSDFTADVVNGGSRVCRRVLIPTCSSR